MTLFVREGHRCGGQTRKRGGDAKGIYSLWEASVGLLVQAEQNGEDSSAFPEGKTAVECVQYKLCIYILKNSSPLRLLLKLQTIFERSTKVESEA